MFTDFNWIAHWNFLLVSWFSKLLLSVLRVCPLIGSFRKILLLQFWLLGLDSVYRKALYGINLLTTVVMRGESVRFLAWSHLASEKAPWLSWPTAAQLEQWSPRKALVWQNEGPWKKKTSLSSSSHNLLNILPKLFPLNRSYEQYN